MGGWSRKLLDTTTIPVTNITDYEALLCVFSFDA